MAIMYACVFCVVYSGGEGEANTPKKSRRKNKYIGLVVAHFLLVMLSKLFH